MRVQSGTTARFDNFARAQASGTGKSAGLLFSAAGKGALLSRIAAKIRNLGAGVRSAAEHVETARPRRVGFSPGRDWDHAANARQTLARQISHAAPNGMPTQFREVWQERAKNPAMFSLFCGFASQCKFRENVDFLNAVDEFRAAPSASKAEQMLETFVTPAPVDDFGIPVHLPGKKQINLASDAERNALVSSLRAAIAEARGGNETAGLDSIVRLLRPVEDYVVSSMSRNISNMLDTELKGIRSAPTA